MKTIIILITALSFFSITKGQDNQSKIPRILYIIRTSTGEIRTNHFLVNPKDVVKLELPSKDQAAKDLNKVITEDIVMYMTPKDHIVISNLTALFSKYNIEHKYLNLPIYVDGILIENSSDIVAADNILRGLSLDETGNHINIITKIQHTKRSNDEINIH